MTAQKSATRSKPKRPLVGCQIRRLRNDAGMTLAEIADATGLNVGYLSQVETDKASPSLETLSSVADALNVPLTWFFSDLVAPPVVVRKKDRKKRRALGTRIEVVDGGIPRSLRIIEATLPPGGKTPFHAHPGDEHHVVLEGRVRLTQGEHVVDLGPGDYLVWDATLPHAAEALGDEPASVMIITPGRSSEWAGLP